MMSGKLRERGRSSAPLLLDGLILRSLQGIMQQLLVVGRIACLVQKDCRYEKQVIRSAGERLKMCSRISEQRLKVSPLMIMGDETARDAPEPFDAIGIRIIGRRVDETQLIGEFGQHAAHE